MAKARILVVDDEPNTIVTLKRALELEGHEVLAADEALWAEQRRPFLLYPE